MYDVIIIGSGISGLICGCCLAKTGLKVLIVEQHSKPGGYCTSFERMGFIFDAAAHSLGGFNYGNLGNIFSYLNLFDEVKFVRADPSNTIITPDFRVSFWADLDKTINDFQVAFPDEKNVINDFFQYIITPDSRSARLKGWSFNDLLHKYFLDDKLKAILSFPLFGNGGLPPSRMSAFIGVKIFKEFLIDGGYYPVDSIQKLPDALLKKYYQFGGQIFLSCRVNKIKVNQNAVTGVDLEADGFVPSRYVVSNCDARQTFFNLIGKKYLPESFIAEMNHMSPSLSAFIVYLGTDGYFDQDIFNGTNLWMLYYYDLEKIYRYAKKGDFANLGGYLLHPSLRKNSMVALMIAPYKTKRFWSENKQKLMKFFIERIDQDILHNLTDHIVYKGAASPHTLHRYTSNYQGAAFGWECTPEQLALTDFRKPSFIQGLYMTGHWTTKGLGIPGVAYVGFDTASMILRKEKIREIRN